VSVDASLRSKSLPAHNATDQAISSIDVAARRGTRCHVEKLTVPRAANVFERRIWTKLIAARLILDSAGRVLPQQRRESPDHPVRKIEPTVPDGC